MGESGGRFGPWRRFARHLIKWSMNACHVWPFRDADAAYFAQYFR